MAALGTVLLNRVPSFAFTLDRVASLGCVGVIIPRRPSHVDALKGAATAVAVGTAKGVAVPLTLKK